MVRGQEDMRAEKSKLQGPAWGAGEAAGGAGGRPERSRATGDEEALTLTFPSQARGWHLILRMRKSHWRV